MYKQADYKQINNFILFTLSNSMKHFTSVCRVVKSVVLRVVKFTCDCCYTVYILYNSCAFPVIHSKVTLFCVLVKKLKTTVP